MCFAPFHEMDYLATAAILFMVLRLSVLIKNGHTFYMFVKSHFVQIATVDVKGK